MTASFDARRRLAWMVCAVVLAPVAVGAQSRETLETKVSVRNDRVMLEWSSKHPWDQMLQSNAPYLLAEYRTASGQLALDCLAPSQAAASAGRGCMGLQGVREDAAGTRRVTYQLPSSLGAVPRGNACLLFRTAQMRLLPLRRVDREGTETARFRFPEWEASARGEIERKSLQRRVAEARDAIEAKRREIAAAESNSAGRGGGSRQACEAIPAPELDDAAPERPTAAADEYDIVARQVCVMRVRNIADRFGNRALADRVRIGAVHPPSILDSVIARLPQRRGAPPLLSDERREQLAIFRRDYAQLAPFAARYRRDVEGAGYSLPHFGAFDDYLALQTYGREAGSYVGDSIATGAPPQLDFALGWVGGNLEAYSRCVVEGATQLATAATTAAELAQRRPALREAARQALVKSCTDGFARLETLRAQLAPLERELAVAEQSLTQLQTAAALPNRWREVNLESCVP